MKHTKALEDAHTIQMWSSSLLHLKNRRRRTRGSISFAISSPPSSSFLFLSVDDDGDDLVLPLLPWLVCERKVLYADRIPPLFSTTSSHHPIICNTVSPSFPSSIHPPPCVLWMDQWFSPWNQKGGNREKRWEVKMVLRPWVDGNESWGRRDRTPKVKNTERFS